MDSLPAFIGYTALASNNNQSLLFTPFRVTSMVDFHTSFGGAPIPLFSVTEASGLKYIRKHTLYYNLLLFFANGGEACYIVSIGDYTAEPDVARMIEGIDALLNVQEPTMVVVPEAVNLGEDDCAKVQEAMLKHCGAEMKNRFAILDVFDGDKGRKDPGGSDVIRRFRDRIGGDFLSYGAAYYPWLNTSIVQKSDLSFSSIDKKSLADLRRIIITQIEGSRRLLAIEEKWVNMITETDPDEAALHEALLGISPLYNELMKGMLSEVNVLPVSAAMAGIYTMVDRTRGIWKAPANVSMARVISPTVDITSEDQQDLNAPSDGKSVNAIRSSTGGEVMPWGARTLDGHSPHWHYLNVRRTMMMLEESVKKIGCTYVSEPNVADTWANAKSAIESFLNGIWRKGGLAGAAPNEAYRVSIEDMPDVVKRINVLVAIARPEEFSSIDLEF